MVFTLTFKKFRFSVITQFPRAESSFGNVFTPFDVSTWTLILAACILITLVVQFNRDMRNLPKSRAEYGVIFLSDLITFTSILLSQYSSDIVNSLQKRRKAVPILTVWFLGCYILMQNLYQGSITSDLTVTPFPLVPRSLEDLAKSKLTVVTTAPILGFQKLEPLIRFVLPQCAHIWSLSITWLIMRDENEFLVIGIKMGERFRNFKWMIEWRNFTLLSFSTLC